MVVQAYGELKKLRDLNAYILFKCPQEDRTPEIFKLSDAAFNISRSRSYGQTGVISGVKVGKIFHPVYWISAKQRRVIHSSYGTEIPSCTDVDDKEYYVRSALRDILNEDRIKQELGID